MRIVSGLLAAAFSVAIAAPASAGCCCNGWNWETSWNWGTGCGTPAVVAYQPVVAQPAPIVAYRVNQGPVYSGPGPDLSPRYFEPARPLAAYPFMNEYADVPAYGPYRSYRPHRKYYRSAYRPYHRSSYRAAPRYHRGDVPPVKYYK